MVKKKILTLNQLLSSQIAALLVTGKLFTRLEHIKLFLLVILILVASHC